MTYRGLVARAGDDVPEDLRADAYGLDDLVDPDGPEDTAVLSLRITRAGLSATAPGAPLTRATWERWRAGHPELDCSSFRFEDDGGGAPGVEVLFPDSEQRRRVHALAVHFGARVVWDFVCGAS